MSVIAMYHFLLLTSTQQTRHIEAMLVRHCRRWPNIKATFVHFVVFVGYRHTWSHYFLLIIINSQCSYNGRMKIIDWKEVKIHVNSIHLHHIHLINISSHTNELNQSWLQNFFCIHIDKVAQNMKGSLIRGFLIRTIVHNCDNLGPIVNDNNWL